MRKEVRHDGECDNNVSDGNGVRVVLGNSR